MEQYKGSSGCSRHAAEAAKAEGAKAEGLSGGKRNSGGWGRGSSRGNDSSRGAEATAETVGVAGSEAQ